ncbi:MAG: GNAT family N-acetyltransferase, partial [Bryobacteraceae bacterium]
SRLTKIHGAEGAEVAVVVSDQWHGRGLGKELMARLLIVAADDKVPLLTANILPDNRDMIRVFEKLGFSLKHNMEDELVHAEFKL